MSSIRLDLSSHLRSFRRDPANTAVAVLTVAVGIAAASVVYSVTDGVFSYARRYPENERLVVARESIADISDRIGFTQSEYRRLEESSRTVELEASNPTAFELQTEEAPLRVDGAEVTSGFLRLAGAQTHLGGLFGESAEVRGRDDVVLLGHDLWRDHFGADPGIVGRVLSLEPVRSQRAEPGAEAGRRYRVLGVLAESFRSPMGRSSLFVPLVLDDERSFGQPHSLQPIGRLAVGASPSAARSELDSLLSTVERSERDIVHRRGATIQLTGLQEWWSLPFGSTLLLLGAAVALVVIISSLNVATLWLTTTVQQETDIRLRSALGATSGSLVAFCLGRCLLLATLGGLLAVPLSDAALRVIRNTLPSDWQLLESARLEARAMAFLLVLTGVVAFLSGLAPALVMASQAARSRSSRGAGGKTRARAALIGAQATLAVVLGTSSLLVYSNLRALAASDPGYQAEGLLTFQVTLPDSRYPSEETRRSFFQQALHRLESHPQVTAAGTVNVLPLAGWNPILTMRLPRDQDEDELLSVSYRNVSPGYFGAMGIPILAGEPVDPGLVINGELASRHLRGRDSVGEILGFNPIAAVVGDVESAIGGLSLSDGRPEVQPTAYIIANPPTAASAVFVVRTEGSAETLVAMARQTINGIDPQLPLSEIASMEEVQRDHAARPRFGSTVLNLFSVVSVLLSMVGVYGVLGSLVAERKRDVAIRMALGGRGLPLVAPIANSLLSPLFLGIALGTGMSLFLPRILRAALPSLAQAALPEVLLLSPVVLILAAISAAWLPLRRASRVEPARLLRADSGRGPSGIL